MSAFGGGHLLGTGNKASAHASPVLRTDPVLERRRLLSLTRVRLISIAMGVSFPISRIGQKVCRWGDIREVCVRFSRVS